jgi:phosphate transport system substrate-binding protein
VAWPIGLGGKGNDGVAGQVKQVPGAIGYVELAYARQNKLPFASIKNSAGAFIAPSVESATAAADGVAAKLNPKTDYRISIANAPGPQAYPITSFTWIIVYQDQTDPIKGKKLVDFMRWALTTGQASAAALDYAPLPKAIADHWSSASAPSGCRTRPRRSERGERETQCDVAVTWWSLLPVRFSTNVQ